MDRMKRKSHRLHSCSASWARNLSSKCLRCKCVFESAVFCWWSLNIITMMNMTSGKKRQKATEFRRCFYGSLQLHFSTASIFFAECSSVKIKIKLIFSRERVNLVAIFVTFRVRKRSESIWFWGAGGELKTSFQNHIYVWGEACENLKKPWDCHQTSFSWLHLRKEKTSSICSRFRRFFTTVSVIACLARSKKRLVDRKKKTFLLKLRKRNSFNDISYINN